MINKLRRRFVIMTMAIITVVLVVIFLIVFFSIKGTLKNSTTNALSLALLSDKAPPFDHGKGSSKRDGEGIPVILFGIDEFGNPNMIRGDVSAFSQEDLDLLVDEALDANVSRGELDSYGMAFAFKDDKLAFVDTAASNRVMEAVGLISLLIFVAAELLFLLLSMLLSKWAVRPTEQAWQQQRRFVADASHELKTPLTIILSNADMELQQSEDADNQHASMIREEALRMKSLVEQMLQMARLDTANKVNLQPLELSQLIEGSLLSFEPVLFENKVNLNSDITSSIYVIGDEDGLRRMFEALLDNAAKYTPSGETVNVTLTMNNKKRAVLTVQNTGVCLSKEQLEHLFDRFYRVEDSRSDTSSFGLGLSIAQSIAHGHKAAITVDSNESIGVRFCVSFPCYNQSSNEK